MWNDQRKEEKIVIGKQETNIRRGYLEDGKKGKSVTGPIKKRDPGGIDKGSLGRRHREPGEERSTLVRPASS